MIELVKSIQDCGNNSQFIDEDDSQTGTKKQRGKIQKKKEYKSLGFQKPSLSKPIVLLGFILLRSI